MTPDASRSPLPVVVVIGPLPPPAFGVATATQLILQSSILRSSFRVAHVDTSDRRGTANMGRIDLVNVLLAMKHEAKLVGCLVRWRPAVVYFTLSQGPAAVLRDWVFLRTAVLFGSSPVAHLRASSYADLYASGPRWLRWVLRDVLAKCARVLVLGSGLVGMAKVIDPQAKVAVAPNGCHPLTAVGGGKRPGTDATEPLIVHLGSMRSTKGVHDVLEAAAAVVVRVPDARFVFGGDWGSKADRLRAEDLVRRGHLEGNVVFAGRIDYEAKVDLLARATALVLASHSEGQPWSILEAMSIGLPVVATVTGAVPDMVVDGVTGSLVEVGDVTALAAALSNMLTDPAGAAAMGARGQERYAEHFTAENSHQILTRVLREAAERERRTEPFA